MQTKRIVMMLLTIFIFGGFYWACSTEEDPIDTTEDPDDDTSDPPPQKKSRDKKLTAGPKKKIPADIADKMLDLNDVLDMRECRDGTFMVLCGDNSYEYASREDILDSNVCLPGPKFVVPKDRDAFIASENNSQRNCLLNKGSVVHLTRDPIFANQYQARVSVVPGSIPNCRLQNGIVLRSKVIFFTGEDPQWPSYPEDPEWPSYPENPEWPSYPENPEWPSYPENPEWPSYPDNNYPC